MKKLLVVIVGVVFMSSCDLGEDCNTECVPGAPELVVQITPQEALDSAYLQYDQWKIYDGVEEMAIRLNNDPNFQANDALFIPLYLQAFKISCLISHRYVSETSSLTFIV